MSAPQARSELLGRPNGLSSSTSHGVMDPSSSTARLRPNAPSSPLLESPFSGNNAAYTGPTAREDFALREHTFLQESENSIDAYLAQGRAVLQDLVDQKGMLRGTKRRLMSAGETLGLSREAIGWINRRRWVHRREQGRQGLLTPGGTAPKTCGSSLAAPRSPSSCFG